MIWDSDPLEYDGEVYEEYIGLIMGLYRDPLALIPKSYEGPGSRRRSEDQQCGRSVQGVQAFCKSRSPDKSWSVMTEEKSETIMISDFKV